MVVDFVRRAVELPGFSTFDKKASKIRTEVNASIRAGIHDRGGAQRAGLMRLLEERDRDGTTLFNRRKKSATGPTWSHFKNLTKRLDGWTVSATPMRGWAVSPRGRSLTSPGRRTRRMPPSCGTSSPSNASRWSRP